MRQLKLFFFDLELESIDRILYYTGSSSLETRSMIGRGMSYFARLRLLLDNETSENKAGYLEKVFVSMNAANVDFRCRLAWHISKANYK